MNERFYQFIWQHMLFNSKDLTTLEGNKLEIIHPGYYNPHSGPDFREAKIRIDETLWIGCVEIHVNSDDWYQHNHHKDKAYNNVILHVVAKGNKQAIDSNSRSIPTLVISPEKKITLNYTFLVNQKKWIPCENIFPQIDQFRRVFWIESLAAERLQQKSERLSMLFKEVNNNFDELFYRLLALSFGFKVNSQPFEQLARLTPLHIIRKICGNPLSVEAFLLGQASLLSKLPSDEFTDNLRKEYQYLKHRFNLSQSSTIEWKFARVRPQNSPILRIVQLSTLLAKQPDFTGIAISTDRLESIKELFKAPVSKYWQEYFSFGKTRRNYPLTLGDDAINGILINTIVPFVFFYGLQHDNQSLKNKSLEWLESIEAEENSITKGWKKLGAEVLNARQSQAYIQLKNEYCDKSRCLDCQIGNVIIRDSELF